MLLFPGSRYIGGATYGLGTMPVGLLVLFWGVFLSFGGGSTVPPVLTHRTPPIKDASFKEEGWGSTVPRLIRPLLARGCMFRPGNANVDGFYLDDNWGRPSPSEEAFPCSPRGTGKGRCVGFTKEDLAAMQKAWASNSTKQSQN